MPSTFDKPGIATDVLGTFMGRDAIALLAAMVELGPRDRVLLPGYLCEEVSRPFARRTQVDFYDIGRDLVVDPAVLRAMLAARPSRLVYVIHYFGFLQPHLVEIREACRAAGAWLVEDCAHALLSRDAGMIGDFVVHSFRKTLPLPDGGGLVLRAPTPQPASFRPQILSDALSILSLAKSWSGLRSNALSRSGIAAYTEGSPNPPKQAARERCALPMSRYARMHILRTDPSHVIARKRTDFDAWMKLIAGARDLRPLHDVLPEGTCPSGCPVFATDRDALREQMRAQGIHMKIHWPLPAEVGDTLLDSHWVASRLFTLPVYPDDSRREQAFVARMIESGKL